MKAATDLKKYEDLRTQLTNKRRARDLVSMIDQLLKQEDFEEADLRLELELDEAEKRGVKRLRDIEDMV